MISQKERFLGLWKKQTDLPCSQIYPIFIEFHSNGLHYSTGAKVGLLSACDTGSWEIINSRQIKISTISDTILAYKYLLSDDEFTFIDSQGCEFLYQKVQ
ncbi:MAG: hypothetical protein N3A59_06155 [Thermodesulfovibrionales bacterium]|nr:hypothetical protein [Thermodesulfovibrionales bacterium]